MNRVLGAFGEQYVAELLSRQGKQVLARNYRTPWGEIDLIAQDGEYIAFIEVKTRNKTCLIRPASAVTKAKQNKILASAARYLQEHDSALQPRFDVAELIAEENSAGYRILRCEYWKGAFDIHGTV